MADRRKGHDIMERFTRLGGLILRAVGELPEAKEWRHVRDQLLRSGTAPGAHYAEAAGAQSRADFVHKASLALKEQREANYWVGVCVEAGHPPSMADFLLDEGNQMVAILTASIRTAKANGERGMRNEE